MGDATEKVAEVFDEIRAEQPPPPNEFRPEGNGRARIIKVVNEDGEVVGKATHGQVLQGLIRHEGIEADVIGERRPSVVTCPDCEKPFSISHLGPLPTRCRVCSKNHGRRRWKKENADKIRVSRRAYTAANADRIRAQAKDYRKENRARLSEYKRAYVEENRDAVSERSREYSRRYREDGRDKNKLEVGRDYYERNREKIAARSRELYADKGDEERAARSAARAEIYANRSDEERVRQNAQARARRAAKKESASPDE